MAFAGFDIAQLPTYWEGLVLEPKESETSYERLEVNGWRKILPSLWKVRIQPSSADSGEYFLRFGQGFDKQWNLYRGTVATALLGLNKVEASQGKVDGWANGWAIPQKELEGVKTLYILYTPERLYLIGWVLTLGTIVLVMSKRPFLVSEQPTN